MTLIAILIGILIDRFYQGLPELRRYERFYDYSGWLRERLPGDIWDGPLGLVAVLAPLLVVMAVLQDSLSGGVAGLLGLLVAIAVLVFTLGPRDLAVDVEHYCNACDDGDEATRAREAGYFQSGQSAPADARSGHEAVLHGVLVGAHDRWFGVMFWFAVLGPVGAVLFRAASLLAQRPQNDGFSGAASQLYGILGWIPSRMMLLSYALSGHFEDAMHAWREADPSEGDIAAHTEAVLLKVGEGALSTHLDSELEQQPVTLIRSAMGLVWRSLSLWLVVIALLILAGWAS